MTVVAEFVLDVAGAREKMNVRLFVPEKMEDGPDWRCHFDIGEPINYGRDIFGVSSFQALILALKTLSCELYSSAEYKEGRLGSYGEFGGDLGIPATKEFLDKAPYPF